MENIASGLAQFFTEQGHEVKVVSLTSGTVENVNYEIVQFPSAIKLFRMVKWCDVFLQFNVSLKGIWPLLFLNRKYVVSHQSTNHPIGKSVSFLGRVKLFVSRFAFNISCSEYVGSLLPKKGIVIPNFYDEHRFKKVDSIVKDQDLVFLGRLVSDKGCDLLLQALYILSKENIRPRLSIIGQGPEENSLRERVKEYHLEEQVNFAGVLTGESLVKELNRHKVMVIPSVWYEPFGIVALEGIACNCIAIGSEGGGLKDAIGKCGFTFRNGDANDLAEKIRMVMTKETSKIIDEEERVRHLQRHTIEYIGRAYLENIK